MADCIIETLKEADIPTLLALQKENLNGNIPAEVAESQGFVSFQYTPEVMSAMCAAAPQIVAKVGTELVGYALVAPPTFCQTHPLLKGLIDITDGLCHEGTRLSALRYYIMGQICVKAGYRGLGIFDALYAAHKNQLWPSFDLCVTEIATANKRSLAAHKRVGFEILHHYEADRSWEIVLWDFNKQS